MAKPIDYATGIESGRIAERKRFLELERMRYSSYCEDTYYDIIKNQKDNINEELKRLGIYNDMTKVI